MNNSQEIEELAQQHTKLVKELAFSMGFSAVGIADATPITPEIWEHYWNSIKQPDYDALPYLRNYPNLRQNPAELFPSAQSVIVVAQNYYPPKKQPTDAPQVAFYAYGKDYHKVIRKKLSKLLKAICEKTYPTVDGRPYCDSAPMLDVYWAERAGLGFKGKNGLLIIPKIGSFVFIGTLITNLPLIADRPLLKDYCGKCRRCIDACPTQALQSDKFIPGRCISYLTIEHKGEILPPMDSLIGNRFYGCDECQKACPHNRFCSPHNEPNLWPRDEIMSLTYDTIDEIDSEMFEKLVSGSAMRRAGFDGLRRNAQIVSRNRKNNDNKSPLNGFKKSQEV